MNLTKALRAAAVTASAALLAVAVPTAAHATGHNCDYLSNGLTNTCMYINGTGNYVNSMDALWEQGTSGETMHFEIRGPWGHWFNSPGIIVDQAGNAYYAWGYSPPSYWPTGTYCEIAWDNPNGSWVNEGEACMYVHS